MFWVVVVLFCMFWVVAGLLCVFGWLLSFFGWLLSFLGGCWPFLDGCCLPVVSMLCTWIAGSTRTGATESVKWNWRGGSEQSTPSVWLHVVLMCTCSAAYCVHTYVCVTYTVQLHLVFMCF